MSKHRTLFGHECYIISASMIFSANFACSPVYDEDSSTAVLTDFCQWMSCLRCMDNSFRSRLSYV